MVYTKKLLLQVFSGNVLDRNEPIGNIIDPPIIARFIRIRVKTSKGHTAMRAEFYGCTEGKNCNRFHFRGLELLRHFLVDRLVNSYKGPPVMLEFYGGKNVFL